MSIMLSICGNFLLYELHQGLTLSKKIGTEHVFHFNFVHNNDCNIVHVADYVNNEAEKEWSFMSKIK